MDNKQIEWCSIPVTIDNSVADLLHMTPPDQDMEQKPEFRVTKATLGLVTLDFARYKPSLERMLAHWLEEKERQMNNANVLEKSKAA
jgi:hypothetical protein